MSSRDITSIAPTICFQTHSNNPKAAIAPFNGIEKPAIASSTKAFWGGSGYSVELFPDSDYRVLWNNNIGNLYDSTGVIVGIPFLSDEEAEGEESEWFFDNAIDYLDQKIEEVINEV